MNSINDTIAIPTFDPKSPSSLIISSIPSSSSTAATSSSPPNYFTSVYCDDGLGCNHEEAQCLMRLIDTHANYKMKLIEEGNSDTKGLSTAYRSHIEACIEQLEKRLQEQDDNNNDDDDDDSNKKNYEESANTDLLKLTLAITHLAEIYLCGSDFDDDDDQYGTNTNGGGFQLITSPTTTMPKKEQNQMGIVTADTIRYLRYHILEDIDIYIENILGDECSIDELLESNQPEHWVPQQYNSADFNNLTPFWALVRTLVQRGLMKDAWNVLCRHSACVRAQEKLENASSATGRSGGYMDQTIREDLEAFALIEKLLLFAPIPGGRTEDNDSGLGASNDEDEDMIGEDDNDDWWNGISSSAFKLWNTSNYNQVGQQVTPMKRKLESPLDFNIYAVMNVYKSWKMLISSLLKSNSALRNLNRRIPNLQSCVWDVIVNTQDSYVESDSWAERVISELLYVRPNIPKREIFVRVNAHMKQCGIHTDDINVQQRMENILLEVMRGNAGSVIEALHKFGGASGAALPATMTALLCCLLVDDGQIKLSDLSYDIQTEKLLSASSAIISSFTIANHNDIGMKLATKLLQPYITPENMQITAHVSSLLNSHWPKTDAEVRGLLDVCMDAVERGSSRMLDACESLCFSRSLFHKRNGTLDLSVYWLLRGIECAMSLGANERKEGVRTGITCSMCYRHLTKLCVNLSTVLLTSFSRNTATPEIQLQIMKQFETIHVVIVEDERSDLLLADPSVCLFSSVSIIGQNILDQNEKEVANAIVHCLEERKDVDGSLISLSPRGFHGLFLSLAYDILNDDESCGKTTSFDVYGMQVLFSCFNSYCNGVKFGTAACYALRDDITLEMMRIALGKGLMRAFVAQNARLGQQESDESKTDEIAPDVNMDRLLGPTM